MIRLALAATLLATPALAIQVCSGGHYAEKQATCIHDADTGWEHGVKWRALGIDAPEMSGHAECPAEASLAITARDRLRSLMDLGYTIKWSGKMDRYHRQLARVRLADGRDAGQVLVGEALAQRWPNRGNRWCGR